MCTQRKLSSQRQDQQGPHRFTSAFSVILAITTTTQHCPVLFRHCEHPIYNQHNSTNHLCAGMCCCADEDSIPSPQDEPCLSEQGHCMNMRRI
jgi:hypothetical protein